MQKKFIALAVAGLVSGAAFAQSNVTVYGVADATFDAVKSSSSTAGNNNLGSMTRVSANSSYLGFKGVESLGNGLNAVFQMEGGVALDGTGNGAFSFGRDTFVGLNGGFGTVVLGTLTGPTRALGASTDVFAGATGIGANTALLGKLGGALVGGNGANSNIPLNGTACGRSATCTSVFDTRWKNAVAYVSPTFGGFSGTFAYVANENKTNESLNGTADQLNTKGYDAGLKYANGPINVGLTYNWATLGNVQGTDARNLRFAAAYDFGVATVRGLIEQAKAKDVLASGDELKQTVYGLGATFNVSSAGKIVGQYYVAKDTKGTLGAEETGAKLIALGYEHSLSKRTLLKATYSRLANDNAANYDFGYNAVGNAAAGSTLQGVSVGLRHSF